MPCHINSFYSRMKPPHNQINWNKKISSLPISLFFFVELEMRFIDCSANQTGPFVRFNDQANIYEFDKLATNREKKKRSQTVYLICHLHGNRHFSAKVVAAAGTGMWTTHNPKFHWKSIFVFVYLFVEQSVILTFGFFLVRHSKSHAT